MSKPRAETNITVIKNTKPNIAVPLAVKDKNNSLFKRAIINFQTIKFARRSFSSFKELEVGKVLDLREKVLFDGKLLWLTKIALPPSFTCSSILF